MNRGWSESVHVCAIYFDHRVHDCLTKSQSWGKSENRTFIESPSNLPKWIASWVFCRFLDVWPPYVFKINMCMYHQLTKNIAFCFPSNMFFERLLWDLEPGGRFKPSEKVYSSNSSNYITFNPQQGCNIPQRNHQLPEAWYFIKTCFIHVSPFHLSACLKSFWWTLFNLSSSLGPHETSLSHSATWRVWKNLR